MTNVVRSSKVKKNIAEIIRKEKKKKAHPKNTQKYKPHDDKDHREELLAKLNSSLISGMTITHD